jgi:4-amino-4-deoxychorismate lyase
MSATLAALVNGHPASAITIHDRGFLYGDGVFRTLRVSECEPLWWTDQIEKLEADAARLAIPVPTRSAWERDIADALARSPSECVLRLVLTRGEGQRGYRVPARPSPTRVVTVGPLPEALDQVTRHGARLRVCALRLAQQPSLAGVKHLNRIENVLARMEWNDPQTHEGLLLDASDRVISGVSSNLFIVRRGEVITPGLSRCGVAGVARDRLMRCAQDLKIPVRVADIDLADVTSAEEVMLTNSLIKVWRVERLGGRSWSRAVLSDQLRERLDD